MLMLCGCCWMLGQVRDCCINNINNIYYNNISILQIYLRVISILYINDIDIDFMMLDLLLMPPLLDG